MILSKVNKSRGDEEVKYQLQEFIKPAMHFIIFFSIALLPYITITHTIGVDTFLDSFEYTQEYDYVKNPLLLEFSGSERSVDNCESISFMSLSSGDIYLAPIW